jgi:hypothetical protein
MHRILNVVSVCSLAVLAACGGSSGNAALSRSFNYGTSQAPSTSEQSAASSAQTSLSQTASFSSAPDGTKGQAIIGLSEVIGAALGSNGVIAMQPQYTGAGTALSLAATASSCTTVVGNTVTFANCTFIEAGITGTLNGSISVSAAGAITWNIYGSFSGSNATSGYVYNINLHEAGNITVTSTKVTGNATSEISGTFSGQGQNVSFGFATAAVIDLTYQTTPSYCVTAGTIEVKRVWMQRPSGATGAQFADLGVKLTWSGCNQFTVAHSQ